MRRSRPDEDLSGFYEEIGLELFKYMLRAGFETQVKLAKACELHPSIINRMLKGKYRGLMCRKVLPMIIRRGGFPSWEELDEFLKLVESVISVRQRVKMRT